MDKMLDMCVKNPHPKMCQRSSETNHQKRFGFNSSKQNEKMKQKKLFLSASKNTNEMKNTNESESLFLQQHVDKQRFD